MKFCDSRLDNTTQELFERLEVELRGVDNLLLVDTAWLACQDLRRATRAAFGFRPGPWRASHTFL